jgi:hypothetical protein
MVAARRIIAGLSHGHIDKPQNGQGLDLPGQKPIRPDRDLYAPVRFSHTGRGSMCLQLRAGKGRNAFASFRDTQRCTEQDLYLCPGPLLVPKLRSRMVPPGKRNHVQCHTPSS